MIRALFFLCVFWSGTALAHSVQLGAYKDDLFGYATVLEQADDGNRLNVLYDRERDFIGRDKIPKRQAKREYLSSKPRWQRKVQRYDTPNGRQKMFAVGNRKKPAVTVIYLYGQGGNRFQGVKDGTFGGNFNRLQNLMVRNNGLLLTPDFRDFGAAGAADIASLIAQRRAANPGGTIVLACGSMGGDVCQRLARDGAVRPSLAGMVLLGGRWNEATAAALKSGPPLPTVLAHGSLDPVFGVDTIRAAYASIRSTPARLIVFENGIHGTPIRMIDWRRELNWILAQHTHR